MAHWKKAAKSITGNLSPAIRTSSLGNSLEGADPELVITLMDRGLNFKGLTNRLKTADQQWMETFLSHGGLSAIFDALETMGIAGFNSIADALKQLECVACVKAVMNNKFGLEFIIVQPGEGYVKKLAKALDTNNSLVKMQIFELLSALCLYSEDGYHLALEALADYKRSKGQRYRFSLLVQELKGAETEEYVAGVLAFINCIIARALDLSSRVKIRNELIALQLVEVLTPWRLSTQEELATQIEVFEESQEEDNSLTTTPEGLDLNSHEDIFNTLFTKVCNTPNALAFLHLLQNLLLLDRDSAKASLVWDMMESLSQQAVLMETPDQQGPQAMSIGLDKLRAALQEEKNRDKTASAAPPPPPPPGVPGAPPPPPPPGIPGAPPPPPPPGIPGAPPPPPPPGIPGAPPPPPPPGVPGAPPPPPPPGIPGAPPPPPPPGGFPGGVPPPPPPPGGFPGGVPPPPPPPGGFPGGVPPPPPPPGGFPGGVPPPPPPPGGHYSFPGAAVAAYAVKMTKIEAARKHKPVKPMKKLNWVKLSQREVNNKSALWAKSLKGEFDTKVDIDPTAVEELFSRAEVKKAKKGEGEETKAKEPSVITLLDQKTSLNVNIFLKQFKMDNGSLVGYFRDGDTSKFSIDQLKALEKLLPDSGQIEMLKSFSGNAKKLGTAEDFFIRLIQVKQYPVRLEAMQLRLEFEEKIADIKPNIVTLESAMDQVMGCDSLIELFHVALITGNIINGGGRAGDAYGFTIKSLSKLKDTKANKPRMSLLHYLAQVCEAQHPDLLKILDTLPQLEPATRLSHEFLSGMTAELSKKVKDLEKKSKKSPDDLKAQLKTFLAEAKQTLDDLKVSLERVTEKMNKVAEFFCLDIKKCKLEELFTDLLNFLRELENAQKENHQRAILEAKRLKREAAKKEADAAKKKKGIKVGKAPEVEEEGCIIDNLLKEIRAGTSLKSSGRKATVSRKSSTRLSHSDLGKLNKIVSRANSVRRSTSRSPSTCLSPGNQSPDKSADFVFPEPPQSLTTPTEALTTPTRTQDDTLPIVTRTVPTPIEELASSQEEDPLPISTKATPTQPVATPTAPEHSQYVLDSGHGDLEGSPLDTPPVPTTLPEVAPGVAEVATPPVAETMPPEIAVTSPTTPPGMPVGTTPGPVTTPPTVAPEATPPAMAVGPTIVPETTPPTTAVAPGQAAPVPMPQVAPVTIPPTAPVTTPPTAPVTTPPTAPVTTPPTAPVTTPQVPPVTTPPTAAPVNTPQTVAPVTTPPAAQQTLDVTSDFELLSSSELSPDIPVSAANGNSNGTGQQFNKTTPDTELRNGVGSPESDLRVGSPGSDLDRVLSSPSTITSEDLPQHPDESIVRRIVEKLKAQQELSCGIATVTSLSMLMVPGAAQLMEEHVTTPPNPSPSSPHSLKAERKSKKHKSKSLPRKSKLARAH